MKNLMSLCYLSIVFGIHIVRSYSSEEIEDIECLDRHKKCLFIVALPETRAFALVDVLNQHPNVKIQGSNGGLITSMLRSMNRVLQASWWGSSYGDSLWRGKYSVAWYNPEKKIDFVRAVLALFNVWYRTGAQEDDVVGYVETSFGYFKETYTQFQTEMDVLNDICRESKFILQLSYSIPELAKREYWKSKENPDPILKRLFYHFQTFHHRNPNNTMIVSDDEITVNSTRFRDIFEFIGLDYHPQSFLAGRFGEDNFM